MNKRKEKSIFRRKRLKKAEKGIYGILPELPGSSHKLASFLKAKNDKVMEVE